MKNEKMLRFAKLFEIGNNQVLVFKDTDRDDDAPVLVQRTEFDTGVPGISIGFNTEESRDDAFEKYSIIEAEAYLKMAQSIFK